MTRDEMRAIIDEAHRMGFRVAAHAEGLDGTRSAIEEGVDTIEHGLSLQREPALLDVMAEQGSVLVPTLSTFHDLAERFTEKFTSKPVDQANRQLEEAFETLLAARKPASRLPWGTTVADIRVLNDRLAVRIVVKNGDLVVDRR
jgi:imidazolonepropionase-like amidohydrolase